MQPLIHQAALAVLDIDPYRAKISPGDVAHLRSEPDDVVTVYVERRSRFPFGLGKPSYLRVGTLEPKAATFIRPALGNSANLRVRVVEVEMAHLSPKGTSSVSISVWGNLADLGEASASSYSGLS